MLFYYELFLVFVLGAVLGSFSSALAYRSPRKISWTTKRSFCPKCETTLGALDLVPIFSWVLSSGKCRHCKTEIPGRYVLFEVFCGMACLLIFAFKGESAAFLFLSAALPFLAALFIIDLKHMILPNQLILSLVLIACGWLGYQLWSGASGDWPPFFIEHVGGAFLYSILAWCLGFLLSKRLNKESLGAGDVKFFFFAGLWLGIKALPYFMIVSGCSAIVFSLVWKMLYKEERFPFGPALIFTFFVMALTDLVSFF